VLQSEQLTVVQGICCSNNRLENENYLLENSTASPFTWGRYHLSHEDNMSGFVNTLKRSWNHETESDGPVQVGLPDALNSSFPLS